jgi:peptide/nickel transport system substrate-binding protein
MGVAQYSFKSLLLPGLLGAGMAAVLAACARPADVQLPSPAPTSAVTAVVPTLPPPPPKTLVVCLKDEPDSLYLYSQALTQGGMGGPEANTILQAIYDGPYDIRTYRYVPVILQAVPSLENGQARLAPASLQLNDLYYDPVTLGPKSLKAGDSYLPVGCHDLSCAKTYKSGTVEADQLVVDFTLRPDVLWSDGEPVTAADSVLSFNLDASAATPSTKYQVNHTASYVALDDRTVQWTGIPGYFDNEYPSDFWSPLPSHVLKGMSADQILADQDAARKPMGWGPYAIDSWQAGKSIMLSRNDRYFRAGEGLPAFDRLMFRFLGDQSGSAIEQLLTGECDVLDEGLLPASDLASLVAMQAQGKIQLVSVPGSQVERLDFDMAPVDGLPMLAAAPTRQALAGCINRAELVKQPYQGLAGLTDSYLPAQHPLYAPGAAPAFDPAAAQAQLEASGWVDEDGNPATPRLSRRVPGVPDGTPLTLRLLTSDADVEPAVGKQIAHDLGDCGASVQLESEPSGTLQSPWPDGPVFGRHFDLAVWAWPTVVSPLCEMFSGEQIAQAANPLGFNDSGFNDSVYDLACRQVLLGLPDWDSYTEGARETQVIFQENLPALPLIQPPRLLAATPALCGLTVDASTFSALAGIEEIDTGSGCEIKQ